MDKSWACTDKCTSGRQEMGHLMFEVEARNEDERTGMEYGTHFTMNILIKQGGWKKIRGHQLLAGRAAIARDEQLEKKKTVTESILFPDYQYDQLYPLDN